MKEFFGIGGYQRPAEGAWSWQHLLFVSLMLAAMIALAIFLGLRNKAKDDKTKNQVLTWAAILIDSFELIKIFVVCYRDGSLEPLKRLLPLFLCSIQLIAIPLAAFAKGKLKEAALDFVLIFGILGGVLGTVGAVQNYSSYPVLSMDNVFSAITHCISGFSSLYILLSGMESMKKENVVWTSSILLGFCVAATIANAAVDYNYMFLRNHDGTPYVLVWNLVGGNPILYPIMVVLLFVVYLALFYYVYDCIKYKRWNFGFEAKQPTQAAIAVSDTSNQTDSTEK